MAAQEKRIVSLLPSTTEIVAALGFEDQLVGRSHECDVPASVKSLPACTEPKFEPAGQSYEIDQRVKALLQEGLSVYRVDAEKLAKLKPDVIITQDHCKVCAATVSEVKKAVNNYLKSQVQVVSVSPTNLKGVYNSIKIIAEALSVKSAGEHLVQEMKSAYSALSKTCSSLPKKRLLCIEWLDPLMTAGNWVPELAKIAGLESLAAKAGDHSPWIEWNQIVALDPAIICIMPCGYSIKQTLAEMDSLTNRNGWQKLQAVQNEQIFIADGHHYFNRPGPRLTDSARILGEIAHPAMKPSLHIKGWINFHHYRRTVAE